MAWSARTIVPESCAHLDFAAIEAELVRTRGNVSGAAKALGVPASDLRKMVWSNEELTDAVFEEVEAEIDDAQAVVFAALRSGEMANRLAAAKVLLRTSAARRRGWGSGVSGGEEAAENAPVTLTWLNS